MYWLARIMAFFFGMAVAGVGLFALAFRFPHAWMPLGLGSLMAVVFGYVRWFPRGAFPFALGATWVTGAFGLWLVSSNVRLPIMQVQAMYGLLGFAALALLTSCGLALELKGAQRRIAVWALWTLLFGLAICFLSGPPGKLDIIRELLARFNLEGASLLVRKLGHFLFYGILGYCAGRCSSAAGNPKASAILFGLFITLSVAAFDELRQSTHPMRVGSPVDVLIDLAGALVFLATLKATKGVRSQ